MPELKTQEVHICELCGVTWSRPPTRGQRPKRCEGCRSRPEAKNLDMSRSCPHCGKAGVRYDASFCSKKCALASGHWSGGRPSVEVLVLGPSSELPELHPARCPPRLMTEGQCDWCDSRFVKVGRRPAKYCSRNCKKRAYHARRGKWVVAPSVRRSIYERDGWLCQITEICPRPEEPIDPELSHSKWAATLDHIVPQSHVLIPDHSPGNLQTAHLWCNSMKGDGTYYEVDVLLPA